MEILHKELLDISTSLSLMSSTEGGKWRKREEKICCFFVGFFFLFFFFKAFWNNFTSCWKVWTPLIPIVLFALCLRGEWEELPLEQFEFHVHSEELQTWLQIMFEKCVGTQAEKKRNRKQELLMMNRASLLCIDFTWYYSLTLKMGRFKWFSGTVLRMG